MLLDTRIPVRYIFKKIKYDIVFVALIGLTANYFTFGMRNQIPPMPISIPAFIGTAISVLLSFKLSQSYDRWWEARKVWGSIVNDSRNFVIQLQSFLPGTETEAIKKMTHRQIAWCYSLANALRKLDPLDVDANYLSENDLAELRRHHNVPLAIIKLNAAEIKNLRDSGKLDVFSHVQLNNTLVNLTNWMGMCERIKNTIFPVTYRIFLHSFIYIFVITLSIALQGIHLLYELPLLIVLSTMFLLLEKSAKHLQDPFQNLPSDTAMLTISRTIETNLNDLLDNHKEVKEEKPKDFFVM